MYTSKSKCFPVCPQQVAYVYILLPVSIIVLSPIHTADATPTQLNSTVESRRRQRCVLGITQNILEFSNELVRYNPLL